MSEVLGEYIDMGAGPLPSEEGKTEKQAPPKKVINMPMKEKIKRPPWMVLEDPEDEDSKLLYSVKTHGKLILNYASPLLRHFGETRDSYYIFEENKGWRKTTLSKIESDMTKTYVYEGEEYYKKSRLTLLSDYVKNHMDGIGMDEEFNNIPLNLIPLQNGLYDWKENKLLPFNKDIRHDWVYPFAYDPEATAPKFNHFLDFICPEEKHFIYEAFGYSFYRTTPFPLIMFIFSAGGCGRSNLFNVLSSMLGSRAVSVKLAKFSDENNRFASSNLKGKEANIVPDDSGKAIYEFDEVKSISGGDAVNIEEKNKQQERRLLHTKFYHGFNNPPKMHDTTEAAKRRTYILELTKDVRPYFKEHANGEHINYMEEAPGIFNHLMAGLRYIMNSNEEQRFTVSEDMEKLKKQWFGDNNDLAEYISEYCVDLDDPTTAGTWCAEFRPKFNLRMNKNYSTTKLKQELKNLGYKVERASVMGVGQKDNAILGLRFLNYDELFEPNQKNEPELTDEEKIKKLEEKIKQERERELQNQFVFDNTTGRYK